MSRNKLSLETWLQKQEIGGEGVTDFKSPEKSISCSFFEWVWQLHDDKTNSFITGQK